jgi:ABC-type nitrate/sulfonate/bicarbonate transport system substrate-binding protein
MPEQDHTGLEELKTAPLPEPLATRREDLLEAHREEVDDLTATFHRAWTEMLKHEVLVNREAGMEPQSAVAAAQNNLGFRRRELEAEMLARMTGLIDLLQRRLKSLLIDAEDYR